MNKRYCENDEEVFEWEKGMGERKETENGDRGEGACTEENHMFY